MMKAIGKYFKSDIVLTVSFLLAAVSCFLVPPNEKYLGYIDFHTLILLFCLMAIIAGLKELNCFQYIGNLMLGRVATRRGVVFTLIFLCFVSSMLITNDVALITFVPFGIMMLEMAGLTSKLCLTVTLMTIAANLGSMFTPIGNPQNLYLYSLSDMGIGRFFLLMLPYTVLAAAVLVIAVMARFEPAQMKIEVKRKPLAKRGEIAFYLVLFFLCILTVAGMIPHPVLLVIVAVGILAKNRGLFRRVDYSLLLTFLFFFIFVGNMKQMEQLTGLIQSLVEKHGRIISVGVSQIISNVPAAMLLSGYSHNIADLIIGTNLGGLGTLIASMASLISYRQVCGSYPALKKRYLLIFTKWNLLFLAVLCLVWCFL